jgi:hypothetical protein
VSTPVGDQPTWDGAGDRDVSGRTRRVRNGRSTPAEPVTVEQLLARQGSGVGRRRAARRAEEPADLWQEPPPAVRTGLPPVPGAPAGQEAPVSRRGGLPPVPGGPSRSVPLPGPAPLPEDDEGPTSWAPDGRPSRRSGPLPPLPGLGPAPGDPSRRRRPPRAAVERPPLSPGRRRIRRVGTAFAALLGVVVLYHLGLYVYVDQKIDRVDALATDGPEVLAPQLQAGNETYLVVGTGVPGQDGPASIATLLASVSGDG